MADNFDSLFKAIGGLSEEDQASFVRLLGGGQAEMGGGLGGGLPQPGGLGKETNYEDILKFLKARSSIPFPHATGQSGMIPGTLPGAGGFAPGGPQLAFGGGSPWPVDPNPSRIHNSMILGTRLMEAIKKIRKGKEKETK